MFACCWQAEYRETDFPFNHMCESCDMLFTCAWKKTNEKRGEECLTTCFLRPGRPVRSQSQTFTECSPGVCVGCWTGTGPNNRLRFRSTRQKHFLRLTTPPAPSPPQPSRHRQTGRKHRRPPPRESKRGEDEPDLEANLNCGVCH